ncbi:MAG TPA: phosphoenolpyruvate--protein phosphotransferase [Thermoanaerobaculia bacterium]|nr:phosphoenolpyruvate--protein phosphotransferase [Thermoanaerobaculia bacterium]
MILVAPIDGWASSLDEVPDAVFSGKLIGDGLAVDPTSATLCAPCDGEVVVLHTAKHAVTLRATNGAEILMHVGIDTVALGGDGFEAHVSQNQRVRAGDPLLTFDLDALAARVKSLMTPVIVVDGGGFEVVRREQQRAVRVGDVLMELRSPAQEIRKSMRVPYEHGIHARPAALLAASLRGFTADVRAQAHGRTANARSAVAWMELGVQRGEEITLIASGADAGAAIAALESAFGNPSPVPAGQPQPPTDNRQLRAIIASRGIAIGPAALINASAPLRSESGDGIAGGHVMPSVVEAPGGARGAPPSRPGPSTTLGMTNHESAELERARATVRAHLEQLHASTNGIAREVLEAHLSFIDDPELLQTAESWIARGKSAGYAWHEAVEESAKALRAVGDPRVAERADDLRDLAGQVLRALAGETPVLDPPAGSILVGQELLPSQLVALPPGRIAGFCTAAGGPTSHVALLASAMNLPALVAAGPEVLHISEGTSLVLDAEQGVLRIAPDATEIATAEEARARHRRQRDTAQTAAHDECRLASGERIEVFANVGALADAVDAIQHGAEGCGLLRTEFLFLDRDTPPAVEQQTETYQGIVAALGGRPVVIRTLDAGSDKPLRYLPLPREENPALGVRGVRASLRNPELLRDQLRAILRVEPLTSCRILVPMITDVAELRSVRELLDALCRELGCIAPPLGVMIETPASALLAHALAEVADFFSIGSNDLSQYTLAMDRGQAELAAQLDALHPAVLRLIQITVTAARAAGRHVAVCGGLASDPLAAPLLVGLGVDELSAVPSVIPELKATLRALHFEQCRALAERALQAPSAAAVRALALSAGGNR